MPQQKKSVKTFQNIFFPPEKLYEGIYKSLQKGTISWWNLMPREVIQFSNAGEVKNKPAG